MHTSLLTFGQMFALQLASFFPQTTKEAQDVHTKAGQAGVMVQETLGVLEELLRLMSRFYHVAVVCWALGGGTEYFLGR